MRKAIALLASVALAFLLCGCGNGLCFDEEPRIRFAEENADLLERCVDAICAESLSDTRQSKKLFTEDGRLFICDNSAFEDEAKTEIQNSDLSELFGTGQIMRIFVWKARKTLVSIEFLMDSIGMGSTSSAWIVYLPSDNIKNAFFYSDRMQFSDFRKGKMGEIEGSDDYLYYVRISPCWYYIEYGD